jgi:hypothetical protein
MFERNTLLLYTFICPCCLHTTFLFDILHNTFFIVGVFVVVSVSTFMYTISTILLAYFFKVGQYTEKDPL